MCTDEKLKKETASGIFDECWLGANMIIPADKDIRAEVLASLEKEAYEFRNIKCYKERNKLRALISAINAYNSVISHACA